jgi:hypothetical protein
MVGPAALRVPALSDPRDTKAIEPKVRLLVACEPFPQFRPALSCPRSLNRDRQCLPLPDKDNEAFAARNPGVDQISLQHRIVLRRQRDHHCRVFRALALVDCRRIREHQLIQLPKTVCDIAAVEIGVELAFLHVDVRHDTEIAVVDLFVVISTVVVAKCLETTGSLRPNRPNKRGRRCRSSRSRPRAAMSRRIDRA